MPTDDGDFDLDKLQSRLAGAVRALNKELAGLRAGRASTGMLDKLMVSAYGGVMPLDQLAGISAPDARTLLVQVWDRSAAPAVEKAILESDLGLNPQTEGQTIRLPIPELTGERRAELGKRVRKIAEGARVAIRNVRRDGIEDIRKKRKDGKIGDDEAKQWNDDISQRAAAAIAEVDGISQKKEKDIMGG